MHFELAISVRLPFRVGMLLAKSGESGADIVAILFQNLGSQIVIFHFLRFVKRVELRVSELVHQFRLMDGIVFRVKTRLLFPSVSRSSNTGAGEPQTRGYQKAQ